MIYLYAAGLAAVNLLWLFLTVLGLPGNWLMILCASAMSWWLWDENEPFIGITILVIAAVLGIIGEILEFSLGAVGAKKAGASAWASLASILGAIVGGLIGTIALPIPILGTLLGVCLGAFSAATAVELLLGKQVHASLRSGQGAAKGQLFGVLSKLTVGVLIYVLIHAAMLYNLLTT
jgi:uncharacterized protein YqgC (DUF456 family)